MLRGEGRLGVKHLQIVLPDERRQADSDAFWNGMDGILDGEYDDWILNGGPLVPD
jgi:hypothetical protein